MADQKPEEISKFGPLVIKPEKWICQILVENSDIIPNKCRPVLLNVLKKGFIEDEQKFGAAFNILLIIISGEGNIDKMSPEDKIAVREGQRLKEEKEKAAKEQKEFDDAELKEARKL